jgi:putative protease
LQNYRHGSSQTDRQQFVAEVTGVDSASSLVQVDVKNKLRVGDSLELLTPDGNHSFALQHMEDLHGNAMHEAPGGGYTVRLALPSQDVRHGLICRYLER